VGVVVDDVCESGGGSLPDSVQFVAQAEKYNAHYTPDGACTEVVLDLCLRQAIS
jgi:hypothetical protein